MSAAVWLVTLRANELASFVRKRMPLRRSSAPSESRFIRNSDIVIPDATQESHEQHSAPGQFLDTAPKLPNRRPVCGQRSRTLRRTMQIQVGLIRGASNMGLYRISNKPKARIQHAPETTIKTVVVSGLHEAATRMRAAALIRR